jgi:hypothetical protein
MAERFMIKGDETHRHQGNGSHGPPIIFIVFHRALSIPRVGA